MKMTKIHSINVGDYKKSTNICIILYNLYNPAANGSIMGKCQFATKMRLAFVGFLQLFIGYFSQREEANKQKDQPAPNCEAESEKVWKRNMEQPMDLLQNL